MSYVARDDRPADKAERYAEVEAEILAVLDGEFGLAAALSTILLLLSGICVYAVFRFAEGRETAFV